MIFQFVSIKIFTYRSSRLQLKFFVMIKQAKKLILSYHVIKEVFQLNLTVRDIITPHGITLYSAIKSTFASGAEFRLCAT